MRARRSEAGDWVSQERLLELFQELKSDKPTRIRVACQELAKYGPDAWMGTKHLMVVLVFDSKNYSKEEVKAVRNDAIAALIAIGEPATKDLVATLLKTRTPLRRKGIVHVLREIGPPCLPELKRAALAFAIPKNTTGISDVLELIASAGVPGAPVLLDLLKSHRMDVKRAARSGLLSLAAKAVPALRKAIESGGSRGRCTEFAEIVGEIGGAGIELLIEMLLSEDGARRCAGCDGIKKLREHHEQIHDENCPDVRKLIPQLLDLASNQPTGVDLHDVAWLLVELARGAEAMLLDTVKSACALLAIGDSNDESRRAFAWAVEQLSDQ